jgi:hypothetical protein
MEEHKRHFPACPFIRGEHCGNMRIEIDPDVNSEKSIFKSSSESESSQESADADKINNNYNNTEFPKFPHFSEPSQRRHTFTHPNWKSREIDCNRLMDAGFFYTGNVL